MSQISHGTYLYLNLFVTSLKFKFNGAFCVFPGDPSPGLLLSGEMVQVVDAPMFHVRGQQSCSDCWADLADGTCLCAKHLLSSQEAQCMSPATLAAPTMPSSSRDLFQWACISLCCPWHQGEPQVRGTQAPCVSLWGHRRLPVLLQACQLGCSRVSWPGVPPPLFQDGRVWAWALLTCGLGTCPTPSPSASGRDAVAGPAESMGS